MFSSQKHVFWQAFLITLLIFGIGVLLGVILENWRVSKVNEWYQKSEVSMIDIKLQSDIYSKGNFNCDFAARENIIFADRIFEEAKQLERYDTASRLTEDIKYQHQKYDLLRTMLFMNVVKIKEDCKLPYHDVIYFYAGGDYRPDMDTAARQGAFSKKLTDVKEEKGNSLLLIPIAVNRNLTSINIVLDNYNISKEHLPVVLIDEKIKIDSVEGLVKIRDYLK
jgi:hypothetical protein